MRPLLGTPQMRHLGPLFIRKIQEWGPEMIKTAWHDPLKITPDVLEGYKKPLLADNWDRALWEMILAAHDMSLTDHLNELTFQILVITGDDDRIVPTEQSVRLAGELPNATLVIIQDAGLVPHEEQPAEFIQAVEEFLPRSSMFTPALPGTCARGKCAAGRLAPAPAQVQANGVQVSVVDCLGRASMSKVAINTPAPDFNLLDFTGKIVRLSDFRGKTNVLLVFNRGFM
jgi:hypothetical protein